MLFGRKQSLVGLDIGSHTIKAVELEGESSRNYRMTRWGISAPLAEAIVDGEIMDRQLVTDAISNLLESRGIRSRNDVSLDFEILGASPNDPKQMQVLLVAAKKDMVMSFSDLMREAGLQPIIVDVDSFAAQNALQANYDFGTEEVVAILNIGAEITNINIIQGGVPYFTKDLQVGGNSFIEAAQRKFNLSQSEAAAAVRGESGGGLEMAPVVEQVCESVATALERAQVYLRTSNE